METATIAPNVDLNDLCSDRADRLDRAASALRSGFGELGLVTISGHGLPREDVDTLYDRFLAVCDEPAETKQRWHRTDIFHQRGYTPPNTERAVVAGGQPDFKECWFAAPLALDASAKPVWPELFADNVWPEGHPGFQASLTGVGAALHHAGLALLAGCERALGLDGGEIVASLEGAAHVTRALRYLPLNAEQIAARALWGEEHTDFNLLTVLAGGRFRAPDGQFGAKPPGTAGLVLRTRPTTLDPGGRKIRGTVPAGCLISQVGQQLEILTGGRFLATPHAVEAPSEPGWSRTSVAHFVHCHARTALAPLAPFATDEALAAYRPTVLAGTYAIKTLTDIGLAPQSAIDRLGYRHYGRLAAARQA